MASLCFGAFQEYLTKPDQSHHATEPARRMLNCGPGFVHAGHEEEHRSGTFECGFFGLDERVGFSAPVLAN
jgi:hypothetical protein